MDKRRENALLDWVTWRGEWHRPNRSGWWGEYSWWQSPIAGPFGHLLERAVQAQFEAGARRTRKDPKTGGSYEYGYPLRWERIIQMLEPGWNLSQILAGKEGPGRLAVLYRDATRIDVPGTLWPKLRTRIGFDAALQSKQTTGIWGGSAGVGLTLVGDGSPMGLRVFAPHEVTFVPAPWNPAEAVAAIQFKEPTSDQSGVIVSDIRDPRDRIWGEWLSEQDYRDGSPPIWALRGPDYPWVYGNDALLHIIHTPGRSSMRELQPGASGLRQATLDAILQLGWARLVGRLSSFNRLIATSDGMNPPEGLLELAMEPTVIGAIWGASAPQLTVLPHGMDAAKILNELFLVDVQAKLSVYDGDLRVRATDVGVQSGKAIEIEREGIDHYAREQMILQEPSDQQIVMLTIAGWNWSIRNRIVDPGVMGLAPEFIPTTTRPAIEYPLVWSQHERAQIAKDMEPTDPVGAWMVRWGMDLGDPQARARAEANLLQATQSRVRLIQSGYAVDPAAIYSAAARNPVEVDTTAVYTPPPEVADAAAQGLMFKSDPRFKNRALVGLEATRLLQRATKLAGQKPFSIGDVRILNAWLSAHQMDDTATTIGEGEWGNPADPAGLWIQWLSQGGDPAVEWCAGVLDGRVQPDVAPLPTPTPVA